MVSYNDVKFDDFTYDDDHNLWSQICRECVTEHDLTDAPLSEGATGICGVEGCENEAYFYIDGLGK